MYFQPRLDSGATGQVQVRNVSLQYVSGTDNSFQLTKDGVTISSAVLNTSGFASQQDVATLQLNHDSLQATVTKNSQDLATLKLSHESLEASVIKDGEVRSKFAMSTESVEISTGTITFSGNTLIIDTDNLKLDKNGKLTMSGNLTSETTADRAYVGDGTIQLSKKVNGSWQDVAKIWADSSDTGMGHLRLFGDSGNTMVDMWANQGSSFLGLYNKNGSHIFKMYGESRNGWAGEGHLEIGGVNGKGILECKYLIVDGHRVALKRVNYKNQEGTSTWEYLLTANQGNGWNW